MRVTHRIAPSLAVLLVLAAFGSCLAADGRDEVDLYGTGWKLWLDTGASWKNDELFLPPVDLTKLKINSPGGGWQALDAVPAKNVTVPGTVEEYLQTTPGPEGDIVGVSWWYRSMRIPAGSSPKKVLLRFEAVRQRAEVYVNQKLVGYDMVGNTPVEVDLSGVVQPGQTAPIFQPSNTAAHLLSVEHGPAACTLCDSIRSSRIFP